MTANAMEGDREECLAAGLPTAGQALVHLLGAASRMVLQHSVDTDSEPACAGFVDIVGYTTQSRSLDGAALVDASRDAEVLVVIVPVVVDAERPWWLIFACRFRSAGLPGPAPTPTRTG